jgi:hypothetical protein
MAAIILQKLILLLISSNEDIPPDFHIIDNASYIK